MFRLRPALVVTLALATACATWADQTREALDKAWTEVRATHNEEAMKLFDSVIAQDPGNAEALGGRGSVLNELGRFQEAIADLEKATQYDPNDAWKFMRLAAAYVNSGMLDKGAAAAREAIRKGTNDPAPHAILGAWLLGQKQFKEAEAELSTAIDLSPADPYTLGTMADLQNGQGHYGLASLYYREALRCSPKLASYMGKLAQLLVWNLNRVDEGIELAKAAVPLDPKEALYAQILCEAYRRKGMASESIEAGRSAVALRPDNAICHYFLASALHFGKQDDEARTEAMKSIEIDPTYAAGQALLKELGPGK